MIVLTVALSGCKGDTGPAGLDGLDGNANVTVYNFGSQTTTAGTFSYIVNVGQVTVDNSLILVYYNPSTEAATAWYQAPGLGSTGAYMTRYFIFQTNLTPSQYTTTIRLLTPDGAATFTTSTTFTKVKIILAPASQIVPLIVSGRLDLADYEAVRSYLGFAE
jgi:hypothetical protein